MQDIIAEIKSIEEEAEKRLKEATERSEIELTKLKQETENKTINSEKKLKQEEEEKYKVAIENYKTELAEIIKHKREEAVQKIKSAEKNIPKAVEFVVNAILK